MKKSLPSIAPFAIGFGVWFVSGLNDASLGSRLLLALALPMMLALIFMAQSVHDKTSHITVKAKLLLPLFVLSAFSCALFLESNSHRIILAVLVIAALFVTLRKHETPDADIVPAIAMSTLFFSSYSLLGVALFLEVPRIVLVLFAGVVAAISAHDVFAHFHPERNTRRLLVLAFSIVAMEFFIAISLLPTTALVGAALLSIPLASSFVVARTLIRTEVHHSFRRELFMCIVCMLAVIVTARWV